MWSDDPYYYGSADSAKFLPFGSVAWSRRNRKKTNFNLGKDVF